MQADPTVVYASNTDDLAKIGVKKWPEYLFWDTLGVDLITVQVSRPLRSHQTYQNPGLPDWPIVSPSAKSIQAALSPKTDSNLMFFYACPGSDSHKFAKSVKQHNKNINSCQ